MSQLVIRLEPSFSVSQNESHAQVKETCSDEAVERAYFGRRREVSHAEGLLGMLLCLPLNDNAILRPKTVCQSSG